MTAAWAPLDLSGKYLVVWLSAEAIETFLGVLEPRQETALMSWTVGGEVVGESGPGLWICVRRVLLPDGSEMAFPEMPTYFLRWELVTTARLYDAPPENIQRIG
jgi:hypothetical protein